eukprot:TRINITY_DN15588_c0_g1_i1.p1 TRINITY_DN15588_c0_g1~~TRINITY_DN15588_c0_g1_i1.p1  ORF type:complete len:375 (-),score=71.12 TRINITY_DN15588_c0_g1_i1:171-1295(-)
MMLSRRAKLLLLTAAALLILVWVPAAFVIPRGTLQLSPTGRQNSALQPWSSAALPVSVNVGSASGAWMAGAAVLLLTATASMASRNKSQKARGAQAISCRAAGETTVGKSDEGLDIVTLKHGDAEATIYLFGGLVASYKVGGHDWLAMRRDAKFDGSKPISGGLPHCFPQFGPGVIQQHGFARNLNWTLVAGASKDGVAVLELMDTEETRKMWPHSFRLTYWVELKENALDTTLRVENLSSDPFDFTLALHSYYSCSKIDDVTIEGPFLGRSKVDKTKNTITAATTDVVKISDFTEEVYRNALPGTCRLTDPAKGTLEIISGGGWRDVVVWNPYGDEGMGYQGFVCCESASVTPITCPPKSCWDSTMRLVARPK